jgi:hypothetical protein
MGQDAGEMIQDKDYLTHAINMGLTATQFIDPIGGQKENKVSAYMPTLAQGPIELAINKFPFNISNL